MGELKPCAWCRSKRKPWYKYGTNSCKWGAAVCSDCGAQAPEVRTGYDESENAPWHEDADREWNTRAAREAVESEDPCDYCEFDKELCDKGGGECAFQCFKGRNLATPAEKVEGEKK